METLPLSELLLNPYNSKDITAENFQRTKRQVILLGQFKPIIVNSQKMIIGGHTRYLVYDEVSRMEIYDIQDYIKAETGRDISEEMAEKIREHARNPKVSYIEFKNGHGGVIAVINGEEQPKVFTTLEQAVMEYALADNDQSGKYTDEIFSIIDQFEINPLDYAVPTFTVPTLQEIIVKQVELPPVLPKKDKIMHCPQCGHEFSA